MTDTGTDISELLADASLGVQIKHAPVEAIIAGGRRRRSRRRAAGAAGVAMAVACTAGILASVTPASAPGGSAATSVAAEPDAAPWPDTQVIATGMVDGKPWTLTVDVWKSAADAAAAAREWKAMEKAEYPDPQRAGGAAGPQLLHEGWYFTNLKVAGRRSFVTDGALTEAANGKVETSWGKLTPSDNSQWFVVGRAAPGVRAVTCTWGDGRKAAPRLRTVAGTDDRFFTIDAPTPKTNAGPPRCSAVD